MLWEGLTDSYVKLPMGLTAENLAEKYGISREECDRYAVQTQARWKKGCEVKHLRFSYNMSFRKTSN